VGLEAVAVGRDHRGELLAIASLVVGVFVALSLLPLAVTGPAGRAVGGVLWTYLGAGAALVPVLFLTMGLAGFGRLHSLGLSRSAVLFGGLVLLLPLAAGIATGVRGSVVAFPAAYGEWSLSQRLVGIIPAAITVGLTGAVGTAGAVLATLLAVSGLTLYTLDWHPFRRLARPAGGDVAAARRPDFREPEDWEDPGVPPAGARGRRGRAARRSRASQGEAGEPNAGVTALEELPPVTLLAMPPADAGDGHAEEIDRLGEVLVETLRTFRVEGSIVGRTTGPVVTQYEVAPAPGVKVGRIAALADDLALAMRAQSIRIIAPIPGKAAVGVEVPNPTPRIVTLRELLETPEWERSRAALPLALGRNLEGKPVLADLGRMPHLLIAGATGSGKSVCINGLITSLIYRYTPAELRMLMIDPKMVELSIYNSLPHLRHPVVTDNRHAAQALKWAMLEMDRRYELFHANGARNFYDFNRKVLDGRPLVAPRGRGGWGEGGGKDPQQLSLSAPDAPAPYEEGQLPYIVIILDELADLMMTVPGEVEKPLAILAQKARATGVHLILATQRPSVNVITGLIKANFPSRIAFRVASKVDSRTIIDQNGAETLLGNGDMLFLPPGKSEPVRIQGAFIGTEETEAITAWYRERSAAVAGRHEEDILAVVEAMELAEEAPTGAPGAGDRDSLFREAAETCIQHQLGSTSLLQRKLRIGYGRAARIIDQLHEAGVLGPADGSKPREVLVGMEDLDRICGD
jgi:S-DNA-T family DNA segregation ATPase FtsK/SpoIIIE